MAEGAGYWSEEAILSRRRAVMEKEERTLAIDRRMEEVRAASRRPEMWMMRSTEMKRGMPAVDVSLQQVCRFRAAVGSLRVRVQSIGHL